jgi:hypothetical protein
MNEKTPSPALTDALVDRYREASTQLGEAPASRVRESVLAYAQTQASARSRGAETSKFSVSAAKKRVANDGYWRYAAAATVVTASFTALLMYQLTDRVDSEIATASAPSTPSAPIEAAASSSRQAQSANGTVNSAPAVTASKAQPGTPDALATVANVELSAKSGVASDTSTATPARAQDKVANSPPAMSEQKKTSAPPLPPTSAQTNPQASQNVVAATALPNPFPATVEPARARNEAPLAESAIATAPMRDSAAGTNATQLLPQEQPRAMESKRAAAATVAVAPLATPAAPAAPAAATNTVTASGNFATTDVSSSSRAARAPSQAPTVARSAQIDLATAVETGNAAQVRLALRQGADANASDANGASLLILATRAGRADIVADLIAASANVNARDRTGMSALAYARQTSNQAVIEALEKAGAK